MLKRLIVLALALAGGWIAYRRLAAPPPPAATFDAPFTPAPPPAAALDAPLAPAESPPEAEPPEAELAEADPVEAYCVRCKERRAIQGMRIETTPSGRRAAKGTCPACGAKLNRFLPSLEA